MTSAKQILSPIHCEGEGKDGLSKDYVETYCYIEGTFNLYMKQAEQQVFRMKVKLIGCGCDASDSIGH